MAIFLQIIELFNNLLRLLVRRSSKARWQRAAQAKQRARTDVQIKKAETARINSRLRDNDPDLMQTNDGYRRD